MDYPKQPKYDFDNAEDRKTFANWNSHNVDYFMKALDDLRNSGTMNMFEAPRYISDEYEIHYSTATDLFHYWTENGSHSKGEE